MNRFWALLESYAAEEKTITGCYDNRDFFDKVGYFSKTLRAE